MPEPDTPALAPGTISLISMLIIGYLLGFTLYTLSSPCDFQPAAEKFADAYCNETLPGTTASYDSIHGEIRCKPPLEIRI